MTFINHPVLIAPPNSWITSARDKAKGRKNVRRALGQWDTSSVVPGGGRESLPPYICAGWVRLAAHGIAYRDQLTPFPFARRAETKRHGKSRGPGRSFAPLSYKRGAAPGWGVTDDARPRPATATRPPGPRHHEEAGNRRRNASAPGRRRAPKDRAGTHEAARNEGERNDTHKTKATATKAAAAGAPCRRHPDARTTQPDQDQT